MAVNVAISKYKQQIQNLQNQINAQQSVYVKQQNIPPTSQQQQPQAQQHQTHLNSSANDYLRGHDPINNLQNNFPELNINKVIIKNTFYQHRSFIIIFFCCYFCCQGNSYSVTKI